MGVGRNVIIIEAARLQTFLRQNQLVQANAIVQKLEVMFENHVSTSSKPEEHAYWRAFVSCQVARSSILSGNTPGALKASEEISTTI